MRILLKQGQCPGDILMLTAAVRDLKRAIPTLEIGVQTSVMSLWDNNPNISRTVNAGNADYVWDLHYPQVHWSDRLPDHFVNAFRKELELLLHHEIPQGEFRGDLYLTEDERTPLPLLNGLRDYWIVDAGYKTDYPAKHWGTANYQRVIDLLAGKVQFVQIGEAHHRHAPLSGVLDLRGKTGTRDLIRLMYAAVGVLTPVSFPMHLAAAVPTPDGRLRPCVILAGGREPSQWEAYPGHQFLHTIGMLPCCRSKACWRSRIVPLGDGDGKDKSLCQFPVKCGSESIGMCMAAIRPERVAELIEMYHNNRQN